MPPFSETKNIKNREKETRQKIDPCSGTFSKNFLPQAQHRKFLLKEPLGNRIGIFCAINQTQRRNRRRCGFAAPSSVFNNSTYNNKYLTYKTTYPIYKTRYPFYKVAYLFYKTINNFHNSKYLFYKTTFRINKTINLFYKNEELKANYMLLVLHSIIIFYQTSLKYPA
jgi:hypothetical protein